MQSSNQCLRLRISRYTIIMVEMGVGDHKVGDILRLHSFLMKRGNLKSYNLCCIIKQPSKKVNLPSLR
jgi:hypothetical protein